MQVASYAAGVLRRLCHRHRAMLAATDSWPTFEGSFKALLRHFKALLGIEELCLQPLTHGRHFKALQRLQEGYIKALLRLP